MKKTTAATAFVALILSAGLLLARDNKPSTAPPAATDTGVSAWFSPTGGCTEAVVGELADDPAALNQLVLALAQQRREQDRRITQLEQKHQQLELEKLRLVHQLEMLKKRYSTITSSRGVTVSARAGATVRRLRSAVSFEQKTRVLKTRPVARATPVMESLFLWVAAHATPMSVCSTW